MRKNKDIVCNSALDLAPIKPKKQNNLRKQAFE